MEQNVFGSPITDDTLKAMADYANKTVTRADKASVALGCLEKANHTNGSIYNATGGTLTYVIHHNWIGKIEVVQYPKVIANGQWGRYLHSGEKGQTGAVVYRGKNKSEDAYDIMVAWDNTLKGENKAYSEINVPDYFNKPEVWKQIYGILKNNSSNEHTATGHGFVSTVSIGNDMNPLFKATVALEDA